MSRRVLRQIRKVIRAGNYDLTRHAIDEMAEDNLSIFDIEQAVLNGTIAKIDVDDPRGPIYTIIGRSSDNLIEVGVVGRLTETDIYLIITVYEVSD